MKRIIMLVGVPAAGKSTWLENEFQGECVVISTDKILEEIADHYGQTYDGVFEKYIKVAERMMWEEFDNSVAAGWNTIIIDRTNLSVNARRKFFERLKNFHYGHGYQLEAVVFPLPGSDLLTEEEWKFRLNNRPGKTIPENVLKSMVNSFQFPLTNEGFSKVTEIK